MATQNKITGSIVQTDTFFRSVLDTIPTGICILDQVGRFCYVNSAMRVLTGYDQQTHHLRSVLDIVHPEDLVFAQKIRGQLLSGESDCITHRMRLRHRNKQYIWVAINVLLSKKVEYSPRSIIVQVESLHEIRELESRLRQCHKSHAITSLAGGIAHGLNNILSSILGNAEFALNYELSEKDSFPGVYSIQQIIKASERAKSLVKQISALSRTKDIKQTRFNVSLVVKEISHFLKSTIPSNIAIQLSLYPENDLIETDPALIHQLLMMISVRAIDSLRHVGGTVCISLKNAISLPTKSSDVSILSDFRFINLIVTYPDIPLPTDSLDLDDMGFSVFHTIAKESGGEMIVTRSSCGNIRFSITLPVCTESTDSSVIPKKVIPSGKERILFIDDDVQIVEFMERSLKTLGYQVTGTSDSGEAWEMFLRSPENVDLVISDMNMNGIPGDELAARILEVRPTIPFIICTGFDELLTQSRAKEIGIDAIIMKPFMMDEMSELIRRVLTQKKQST